MRTQDELTAALRLRSRGSNPTEIARLTAIPRSTVRDWCNGSVPQRSPSEPCLAEHWACEFVGVHCTRPSDTQIAIYSKAAVARLDEFVGPKG